MAINSSGLFAVGTRFVDTSFLGYVPPEFLVSSRSGEQLLIDYGLVYNPSTEPAVVTMEVRYIKSG